ncbi:hypothetical protein ABTU92_29505, partial [Rhodoplanes sp. SY1]
MTDDARKYVLVASQERKRDELHDHFLDETLLLNPGATLGASSAWRSRQSRIVVDPGRPFGSTSRPPFLKPMRFCRQPGSTNTGLRSEGSLCPFHILCWQPFDPGLVQLVCGGGSGPRPSTEDSSPHEANMNQSIDPAVRIVEGYVESFFSVLPN